MIQTSKFYFLNCKSCKKSIKVSIDIYNKKEKQTCNNCLEKIFTKIKSKY